MQMRPPRVYLLAILAAAAFAHADTPRGGLIPFDTRWVYPQFVSFRPANDADAAVNPPRFSWSYYPWTLAPGGRRARLPITTFRFQVSRTADFAKPEVDIETDVNFYNALAPFAAGTWYWRIGYDVGKPRETWSPARTFRVSDSTPKWDRRIINEAAKRLAAMPHPRYVPKDGDWGAFRKQIESDPDMREQLRRIRVWAGKTREKDYWKNPPTDDRFPKSVRSRTKLLTFHNMTRFALYEAFLNRIGERDTFDEVKRVFLHVARIPKGGWASPEGHGSTIKHTTIITTDLAIFYDWFYDRLTPTERQTLLDSIEWRIHAQMYENPLWLKKKYVHPYGMGVRVTSHPFQDIMWVIPGAMLTAGEAPSAADTVRIGLNFLTGVTGGSGPDEGWNEGPGYGAEKGGTMIKTSLVAEMMLPELNLAKNPFYSRLAEWYRHLIPVGIQRLGFGDLPAGDLLRYKGKFPGGGANAWLLAHLTGAPVTARRAQVASDKSLNYVFPHVFLPLFIQNRYHYPEPGGKEKTWALFPEAGWVMESTRPPASQADFDKAMGIVFQCRPRGGYSHSYRSDNSFVWYAYGQTLSAGGASMIKMSPHTRMSIAHNVVAVNGKGYEWDDWNPKSLYVGRLLAYERGDGYTWWVGDATHGFQGDDAPKVRRWHRHVVFTDDAVVVLDDLAMRDGADPAKFSYIYHVAPRVPLTVDDKTGVVSYAVEGVKARLAFGGDPAALDFKHLKLRDGYKNPITGEDHYRLAADWADRFGKSKSSGNRGYDDAYLNRATEGHVVWATNREPAKEWTFLTVLSAAPKGGTLPSVTFPDERTARIEANGKARTISFGGKGDIAIDVDSVRRHADVTDPNALPEPGAWEDVRVGNETIPAREYPAFTFRRSVWPVLWMCEGNGLVAAEQGNLRISTDTDKRHSMLWLRPLLPPNTLVRIRLSIPEGAQSDATQLGVYLNALQKDGTPNPPGESGRREDYTKLSDYHFDFSDGTVKLRHGPGDRLLKQGRATLKAGKEHEIVVMACDGVLRAWLDGKLAVKGEGPILPGGRLGLRSANSDLRIHSVEIAELRSDPEKIAQRERRKKLYKPIPLTGAWRVKLTQSVKPSPSIDQPIPDPGISELAKAALKADFDDSKWQSVVVNGTMETFGEGWQADGEAVLRTTVDIPKEWAGRDLMLHLGRIDDFDVTTFNGKVVGGYSKEDGPDAWSVMREYKIPGEAVKPGRAVIAVRVWDHFGGGGFTSPSGERFLRVR